VCDELIRRGLDRRVRWYTYMAVVPFDADLARRMARAGCVGINFTSDAAAPTMLNTYRQPHRRDDLSEVVRLCREYDMAVMLDLLLGGPGETPETLAETIRFFRQIEPDCAGAALGVRIYPGTEMATIVAAEGAPGTNPNLRRHYEGPIDLLQPTFYISSALGPSPARLVRDLIGSDPRFFPPEEETPAPAVGPISNRSETVGPISNRSQAVGRVFNPSPEVPSPQGDHNYNQNQALADAIAAGARGAYWDILRKLRSGC
jgi:radical SAM superfamily enzyme YgiQ (UPF0313 family)